jgi:hypothetical protein
LGEAKENTTTSAIRPEKASSRCCAPENRETARRLGGMRSHSFGLSFAVFGWSGHGASPRSVASRMISSWLAPPGKMPVSRPSHITAMRWLSRSTSGSSEEMTMMALALCSQRIEELVDFGLGADVDAARRLVEDQHVAIAQQPLGDDDLLLVAAREQARFLGVGRGLDRELPMYGRPTSRMAPS